MYKICRNAVYLGVDKFNENDYHLISYLEVDDNGNKKKVSKVIRNYPKTFWIARKFNRKYKQHKERMHLDDCEQIKCPRFQMPNIICKRLGMSPKHVQPRQALKNPYVFGTDLSSTAEIKHKFNAKWNPEEKAEFADVAVFDVETNMRDPNKYNHIDMASLTFKEVVVTAICRDYFLEYNKNLTDEEIIRTLEKKDNQYLSEVNQERNIKQEWYIVDTEVDVLKVIFKRASELKPDFITAWNMDFDINRVIEACDRAGIRPEDIIYDPEVPPEFRFFKYDPGPENKVSDKGVFTSLNNYERWGHVLSSTNYYFVDAMTLYYRVRSHLANLPSYSLDYILAEEFPDEITEGMSEQEIERCRHNSLIRKLKFKEANMFISGTPEWHNFMQTRYPFEYVIYNKFDCIAIEYLDEQTRDIKLVFPKDCANSDYKSYASGGRILADNFHWFNLEDGYAYGTGSSFNVLDYHKQLTKKSGWIIALNSTLFQTTGLNYMEDAPDLPTNVTQQGADIDVVSSYPKTNESLNTSLETLVRETIEIQGVPEHDRREAGVDILAGFNNALLVTRLLFNGMDVFDMLKEYQKIKS